MVDYDDLTDEQQRAVDALNRNVTLTAGAGTGKTTTLTTRYLEMFEQALDLQADGGDLDELIHPGNILTTTFTERAANELRKSIRTEITDRIASLSIEEFAAWRTIADELEYGYIHTLHGFCARLLREHALTIDAVDPGFTITDEGETAILVHDTVVAVLEDYEDHEATRALARQFSRSQLQRILTDLLDERPESVEWANRWVNASEEEYLSFVQSELHPIDPETAAERLSDPEFVSAVATLNRFIVNPPDTVSTGGRTWKLANGIFEILGEDFDDGVPSPAKQETIAELSRHLTKTSGERYGNYTGAKSRWDDPTQKEEFDQAFETLVDRLQPENFAFSVDLELEAESVPFVTALAELTQIVVAEYESRKDRQNIVDFSDLITLTVEFLEADENEAIRQQLREQFEYVMIDEFQDTDPRQWDLIKLLTAGEKDTFDAQNVFVVGDAKQSIYRFRNADVAQFQETAQTLEQISQEVDPTNQKRDEENDDQLSTNFRTLPTVLHSINELFDAVFEEDGEPYEAAPQSLVPHRDDPAGIGSVEYLAVPIDQEHRARRFGHYEEFAEAEPAHDVELEAMALAARLSQIIAEPYQIYAEGSENESNGEEQVAVEARGSSEDQRSDADENSSPRLRDIEPNDIAILIRSRTHLKRYERALKDQEIPYSVASGIGFYETTEITALLNLFRALAEPYDERALYAALRSPLFGLTDDTLAQLKLQNSSLWDGLEASEQQPLKEIYEYLQEWRQLAGIGSSEGDDKSAFDGSWAAYLTHIIEETGYLINISADERPEQARANVEKFREQLRGWSDDSVRSLATLVNTIERRIEFGGRESEASTTGEGVQILTIHDAKGMEFPFVVVPGISQEFKDEASLGRGAVEFEQISGQNAIGMKAPNVEDLFEMEDTIARESIREQRRAEERAEEKRVLYVACTRARDHLLLSGLHDVDGDVEEPTCAEFAEPDPESASSWRDWIQPELLTETVCAELENDNHIQHSDGEREGAYTVSLPTSSVEGVWTGKESDLDVAVELSPQPPQPEVTFRLSATDLAKLLGGYGELKLDEHTRTIYFEETDDSDAQADSGSNTTHGLDIDPAVFGEMVHRICELRPPEERWPDLMEQTLVDEGATTDLTAEVRNLVSEHAQRGINYVDAQTAGAEVEQQYNELYVTAELGQGEISGFIDHLILTPNTYHIIDYKTGSITPEELAEEGEYYANQMKAYAVALNQQRTRRDVRVSLVFTTIDEAWEVEWSTGEIESFERSIEDEFETRASL